jgi:hypothetical protein
MLASAMHHYFLFFINLFINSIFFIVLFLFKSFEKYLNNCNEIFNYNSILVNFVNQQAKTKASIEVVDDEDEPSSSSASSAAAASPQTTSDKKSIPEVPTHDGDKDKDDKDDDKSPGSLFVSIISYLFGLILLDSF